MSIKPDFKLKVEWLNILKKHRKIFDLMCNFDCVIGVSEFKIELKPDEILPRVKPRKDLPRVKKTIEKQIQEWLILRIIQQSTSSVASQFVDIPNKKAIRLCVDYTQVFKNTVKIQYSKCKLSYEEILYVGHLLLCTGLRKSDDRKKKFQNIPTPHSKTLSFLRIGQYFHHFVPKWAKNVQSL